MRVCITDLVMWSELCQIDGIFYEINEYLSHVLNRCYVPHATKLGIIVTFFNKIIAIFLRS